MKRMKKVSSILLIALVLSFTTLTSISATSGRLKGKSIITCNGKSYGNHGDGHWYVAVNHGEKGWYPSGESLGYANPCAASEAPAKKPEAKAPETKAPETKAPEVKAPEVKAPEAKAPEVKQETKPSAPKETPKATTPKTETPEQTPSVDKVVEEVVELDEIDTEALELETKALNNTAIQSISIGSKAMKIKDKETYFINSVSDIKLNLENEKAEYKIVPGSDLKPFEKNNLKIELTSENKEQTQTVDLPVFILGTNDELKSQNVVLKIDNKDYKMNDKYFEVKPEELSKLNKGEIFIGDTHFAYGKDVKLVEVSGKDYTHELVFDVMNNKYSLPIQSKEASSSDMLLGGLTLIGGGSIGAGLYYNKKKKASPKSN